MIDWLQKVYETAHNNADATPAAIDPDNSAAASVASPHAIPPSSADVRLRTCAGSPPLIQRISLPIAKYSGYPSRAVTSDVPTTVCNDPVSPKSRPGSRVA